MEEIALQQIVKGEKQNTTYLTFEAFDENNVGFGGVPISVCFVVLLVSLSSDLNV